MRYLQATGLFLTFMIVGLAFISFVVYLPLMAFGPIGIVPFFVLASFACIFWIAEEL